MNTALKALIGMACLAVLAYVGYFFYEERRSAIETKRQQEIADQALSHRLEREQARETAIAAEKARLESLSEFGCIQAANAAVEAIEGQSSVDEKDRADLKICAKYRLITDYQIARLLETGILVGTDPVLQLPEANKALEAAGVSRL
jgi:hypothetical protein